MTKYDDVKIQKNFFDRTSFNEEVYSYEIENSFLKIEILNFGAIIKSIFFKKSSNKNNLVLSYDKIKYYENNGAYIGATVGRTAGRIKNGLLKIDDKIYNLTKNNNKNHIHGGVNSISNKIWQTENIQNGISMSIFSKEFENGYPANVKIEVEFKLLDNVLEINYIAHSDKKTYINLTNHSYFNFGEKNIQNAHLLINSDYMISIDDEFIPKNIRNLDNTIFDFRKSKKLSDFFIQNDEQKEIARGIDHPFILNSKNAVSFQQNDIQMQIETSYPAVVVYTGNFLSDIGIENNAGICFETQEVPNLFSDETIGLYPKFTDEKNYFFNTTKYIFSNL